MDNFSLWKGQSRQHAEEIIQWLLSIKKGKGLPFDERMMIALYELKALSGGKLLNIHPALDEMFETGKDSVDEFEEIYYRLYVRPGTTNRPDTSEWTFFLPIHFELKGSFDTDPKIRIHDVDFTFITKEAVEEVYGIDFSSAQVQTYVRRQDSTGFIPSTFIVCSGEGRSIIHAWKEIHPAFDTLRGVFEYWLSFGTKILIKGLELSPRGRFPHPLWILAKTDGEPLDRIYFLTDKPGVRKGIELTQGRIKSIIKEFEFLNSIPKKGMTASIISDSLRLYGQALEYSFEHSCLLGLWHVLEALVLSEGFKGDTEKVCKRIAWHGRREIYWGREVAGLSGSGIVHSMKILAKLRNDIVHRGWTAIEVQDVNVLKMITETALEWLIIEREHLSTKSHLEEFYRLRDMSDEHLTAIPETIEYIRATRRGESP